MTTLIEVGGEMFLPIGIRSRSERRVDDYCNGCGTENEPLIRTRDGYSYCPTCAVHEHICEICGSTRLCTQPPEQQMHFEEECFK